ncbi:hypothetical protein N7478_003396 [Penicillium angulare]|uniref:uncharacterized protein n=1 Tax=Penicillium angulare TaxID=116970 RepID=UPI0025411B5E|nr:uncharacterized protein N7478_003396 [Penicillium angulare]KAJ5287710.1 hypothetical protein N7478_003396 [Penicillium angulare]
MASAAEAIVLSSSPIASTHNITKSSDNSDHLPCISQRNATPPPLPSPQPSPSKQPCPTRSKFFAQPDATDAALKKKRQPAKKATATKKSGTRTSKKAKEPESGTITLAGKVIKANGDSQAKKGKKSDEKLSTLDPSEPEVSHSSKPSADNEDLQLDEAIARRRHWTPPRETSQNAIVAEDESKSQEPRSFGKLLSDYNYPGLASESASFSMDDNGPTKRRKIELVDSALQSMMTGKPTTEKPPPSTKRAKKPKRFTTLTARMTAQYTSNEVTDTESVEDTVPEISKAKSRQKKKAKSASTEPAFVVLSPEAAAKALDDQDLVFGSCSQLERENSPQASTVHTSEVMLSGRQAPGLGTPSRLGSSVVSTKNLWGVAARDIDGSLIQAEKRDFGDLAKPSKKPQTKQKDLNPVSESVTIEHLPLQTKAQASAEKIPTEVTSSQGPSMPQYTGFTDAELSKHITSFGFKAVRGRKKMIELLQKCWESKHGSRKPAQTSEQITASKPNPKPKPKPKAQAKAKPKRTEKEESQTIVSSASVHTSAEVTTTKQKSLPNIFTQITKAVRAQPSISSRKHATWHEKILTYDPIILEDITAWLNVEGFGLVDEDREVSSLDVRTWCESHGICCCWKQNASW